MAKNYTIGEAAQVIFEGTDHESILDLGRRYPLLTTALAKVVSKAGEEFVDFMGFIPEYVSANKVNSQMKKQLLDDEEAPKKAKEDKPAKATSKKAKKASDDADDESIYSSMKGKQLNELLDQVGGRKKCQKEFGDCKNGSMIKFLEKYYPNGVDDADDDDEEEEDGYDSMSEAELFKLCKSRGIKAQKGKKAKYYIGLLEKADAASDADEDEDDDEWEEVEQEKPTKKADKKSAKKAAKKEEVEDDEEEDDDDDWDI